MVADTPSWSLAEARLLSIRRLAVATLFSRVNGIVGTIKLMNTNSNQSKRGRPRNDEKSTELLILELVLYQGEIKGWTAREIYSRIRRITAILK